MTVDDIRSSYYETALAAGLPAISGDKCCRLLAWLYVYGGGREETVFDVRLNAALMYAQRRLNVLGGERPDAEWLPVLQGYVKSVSDYRNPPEWVSELEKEYGVKPRR